ncbi:MAG: hypothetical protein ABI665_05325 [Vicinamibacterales bacterium]
MRITQALLVGGIAIGLASCTTTPTAPSTAFTSPATETFSSLLNVKGTASRSFNTHGTGAVSLTLTSTTPSGVVVGIGVGIPRSTGAGCSLTASVNTAAGSNSQVSVTAETGNYCVQVYDPGTISEPVSFSLSITHP